MTQKLFLTNQMVWLITDVTLKNRYFQKQLFSKTAVFQMTHNICLRKSCFQKQLFSRTIETDVFENNRDSCSFVWLSSPSYITTVATPQAPRIDAYYGYIREEYYALYLSLCTT